MAETILFDVADGIATLTLYTTADLKERLAAVRERREPRFSGR